MKCEACEHENIDGARFCAKCGAAIPVAILGQADPLIGQLVAGRFLITGVLGEGGMGVVYAGEQQMGTTVRKVAVKTLHQHLSNDVSVQARFNREVGTVAQLEHPNTIKVYDFGKTKDGQLYIAMEFVSGRSLADILLKDGALSADRTVHIMRQICGALDEAHQQGIIHRDLKPDNVILTNRAGETDFVKVLDFGIAARTESGDAKKEQKLTQQGMVLGTPPYMSPEQFTGRQLDVRSDVYSLGVMAYEMVTGKLPFDAETPWEWATQHMTVQPKPLEVVAPQAHLPEGFRHAILRALSKDAAQRQDSARQFFAELSGGARITVEANGAPAAQPMAYQATAAMPAASQPGGYAPTAQQPQVQPLAGSPMGAPATGPAVVSPVIPAGPARPPHRGGGGSNKGLIFGLGGLGLVLVVAIVIVLVRTNQPDDVAPLTAPLGTASTNMAAAVVSGDTPAVETPPANVGVAQGEPSQPRVATGKTGAGSIKNPSGGKTPAASAAGANPPATGASPAGNPPPANTQPTQPASGGASDACAQCVAAANAGNIAGARTAYDKCADPGKKGECLNAAKRGARVAAKNAADAKNCAAAKAIVAAANAMGAGSPALNGAVASCP
ncbi:MAG TPA: protein kinase [Polyangiaceae bacterium]|nr:protein kinase [Polyangiaceae bacterium]